MKHQFVKEAELVDFGAPTSYGAHLFRVEIPDARTAPVRIIEHYGLRGLENGIPLEEVRAEVKRSTWPRLAETTKFEFNRRLKEAGIATGRWKTGENRLDRLLGNELCVLAWAVQLATIEQVAVICRRWLALRPEERWWLFSVTVAEAGLPEDAQRGWRKALYFALSDGERQNERRRPRPQDRKEREVSLFEGLPI